MKATSAATGRIDRLERNDAHLPSFQVRGLRDEDEVMGPAVVELDAGGLQLSEAEIVAAVAMAAADPSDLERLEEMAGEQVLREVAVVLLAVGVPPVQEYAGRIAQPLLDRSERTHVERCRQLVRRAVLGAGTPAEMEATERDGRRAS
jgi:hypothetical protein